MVSTSEKLKFSSFESSSFLPPLVLERNVWGKGRCGIWVLIWYFCKGHRDLICWLFLLIDWREELTMGTDLTIGMVLSGLTGCGWKGPC